MNNDLDAAKRNANSESMIMKLFSACKAASRAFDVAVFAEAKKVLDNGGTRGKAMAVENKYVHTLIAAPNYLKHLKELTEFCNNYKI